MKPDQNGFWAYWSPLARKSVHKKKKALYFDTKK